MIIFVDELGKALSETCFTNCNTAILLLKDVFRKISAYAEKRMLLTIIYPRLKKINFILYPHFSSYIDLFPKAHWA